MGSVVGVLDRPTLGGIGLQDDDIVACVVWRRASVLVACSPLVTDDDRVHAWLARTMQQVSEDDPLDYLLMRDLLLG